MTRWGGHVGGRISVKVVLGVSAVVVAASAVAVIAMLPAPSDDLLDAVRRDARTFAWPVVIALSIVAYLAFQHRADRHERKLADAPLDQGERLRFK